MKYRVTCVPADGDRFEVVLPCFDSTDLLIQISERTRIPLDRIAFSLNGVRIFSIHYTNIESGSVIAIFEWSPSFNNMQLARDLNRFDLMKALIEFGQDPLDQVYSYSLWTRNPEFVTEFMCGVGFNVNERRCRARPIDMTIPGLHLSEAEIFVASGAYMTCKPWWRFELKKIVRCLDGEMSKLNKTIMVLHEAGFALRSKTEA